jgi:ABC-type dipeptide/oligopeptide/nickel transport system permease component
LGEIGDRIPVTLQLITISFVIAVLIGLPIALLRAFKPGGKVDRGVFMYGLFAGAQPEFWWGIMFIFVFSYKLGIFPQPVGLLDRDVAPVDPITHFILIDSLIQGRIDAFTSALWHFMLPCLTLAFVVVGPIIKTASEALAQVLQSDFVLQARARGLPTRRVAAYALRNALAPVVTLTGILYGYMLGGAVLIEQIFSLNGIGQYALQRTLALDYPSIQGVVLVMTAFSLLVYLTVDVLYAVIDPRIRL